MHLDRGFPGHKEWRDNYLNYETRYRAVHKDCVTFKHLTQDICSTNVFVPVYSGASQMRILFSSESVHSTEQEMRRGG